MSSVGMTVVYLAVVTVVRMAESLAVQWVGWWADLMAVSKVFRRAAPKEGQRVAKWDKNWVVAMAEPTADWTAVQWAVRLVWHLAGNLVVPVAVGRAGQWVA